MCVSISPQAPHLSHLTDLLLTVYVIQIETGTIEFRDTKLEKLAALTPADRKWMDDVVRDVNENWDESDQAATPVIQ